MESLEERWRGWEERSRQAGRIKRRRERSRKEGTEPQRAWRKESMNRARRRHAWWREVVLCKPVLRSRCHVLPFRLQNDEKMNEVMELAHAFLQNFCRGNPQNQVLLHKHLNLFLTPGVSTVAAPNTYGRQSAYSIYCSVKNFVDLCTSFFPGDSLHKLECFRRRNS